MTRDHERAVFAAKMQYADRVQIRAGMRVVLVGDHPWSGHSGVVEEALETLAGPMWSVHLDNGSNAGATTENMRVLL